MDEFEIIANHLQPLAKDSAESLGLKDDCAIMQMAMCDFDLVITKDGISQGVHFLDDEKSSNIAKRLLRVNLSDLASMGAKPYAYMLAMFLPKTCDSQWIERFCAALHEDINEFGGFLIGGDTVRCDGALSLSLTAFGKVEKGKALTRSKANPGELIYVTGVIGEAALGLKSLLGEVDLQDKHIFEEKYRLPQPRVSFAQKITSMANACVDVSDGFIADAKHIYENSNYGMKIHLDKVPVPEQVKSNASLFELALTGGDDYELVFTLPRSAKEAMLQMAKWDNVPVTEVGEITEERDFILLDKDGNKVHFAQGGYNHYKISA